MRVGKANGEDWLRLSEAAGALGVSLNTVRRWSDSGKLTSYRSPGGHRRYRRRDVESLLLRQRGDIPAAGAARALRLPGDQTAADLERLRTPLTTLAQVAAEGIGVTSCLFALVTGDSTVHIVADHRPPGAARYVRADADLALERAPAIAEVLRTGRRLVIADLGSTNLLADREADIYRACGEKSLLALPLTVNGRFAGVMELVETRAARAFTGANIAFAEFMAGQASRFLDEEPKGPVDAEPREQDLAVEPYIDAPPGAAPHHGPGDSRAMLQALVERLRGELDAVACDVLRYDPAERALTLVSAAAQGNTPPLEGLFYPVADLGGVAAALEGGEVVTVEDLGDGLTGTHLVRYEENGARSILCVPLHLGDEVVGLLEVFSADPHRRLERQQLGLVEAAAAMAALALAEEASSAGLARRLSQLDELIAELTDRSSTSDAEDVVRAALQSLREHNGLTACTLYRVVDGVATAAETTGVTAPPDTATWRLEEYPAAATAVAEHRTLVAMASDDPQLTPAAATRFVTSRGLSGVVLAPLFFWGRLVGLLEVGAPQADRLAAIAQVVEMTAGLLAATLGGGDVITRLQRRNRVLMLVVEAGLEDTAKLSTDEVLHAVVERLSQLTHSPVADIYAVEGNTLRALVSYDNGQFDDEWEGVAIPLPRYPCSRRAIDTGDIVVAAGLDDPLLTAEGRHSLEKWGYQSQLSMPLVAGGRVLGLVELSDYTPRDFAPELELIRGLGQVAAHALENAALFEQVERRSRALNELVELGAMTSGARDLDALLGHAAERLLAAVDAANCDIFRVCDEGLRCVASFDRSGRDEGSVGGLLDLDTYPTVAGAANALQVLVVTSPDDPQLSEEERRSYREFGFASEVCIPLVVNGELSGLIDIYDTRERDYAEYLGFLKGAGQTLAGAFESAQLFLQLERRSSALREIVDLGAFAAQSHDLQKILSVLAQRLRDTVQAADCDIFTLQGDQLRCLVSADRNGLDESVVGRVLDVDLFPATAMAVRSGEVMAVASLDDPRLTDSERTDMGEYGYQSELCIPLVIGERVIGIVDVFDTRPRDYAEYLDFLRSVGQTAAGAIENALLVADLERRNAALADLVEDLRVQSRENELLNDIARATGASLDLGDIAAAAVEKLRDLVPFDRATLVLLHGESSFDVVYATAPRPQPTPGTVVLPSVTAFLKRLLDEKVLSLSLPADAPEGFELPGLDELGAAVLIALTNGDELIGALALGAAAPDAFAGTDHHLLERTGTHLALAVSNAGLYDNIQTMHLSNLKALSSALNAKDYYTLGHAARVAAYMVLLGEELGWARDLIRHVEEAAYLHDIGKIGVSDRVLLKPGGLNTHEWRLMRQHPILSADIIRPLFAEELVGGVRHHHERWEGGGYPDGLAGVSIPVIARAMCVADSYDAMSFRRPYRQALDYAECVAELRRCSGSQFDPEIVEAFVCVLERVAENRAFAAGVAREAAARVDPDEHALLRDRDDESLPAYQRITGTLREVCAEYPPTRFITSHVRLGRKTTIICDSGDVGQGRPHVGDDIIADDELLHVFAGESLDVNVLFADQWGVWVSGTAPLVDAQGIVVAVFAAQIPATEGITAGEGVQSTVAQTLASMLDSTAAQAGRSEVEAITDTLTGLYNHRYFHERLSEELDRCQEQGGELSLLFCDLDDFRAFNEMHGHGAGDRAIRAAARIVEDSVRHVDLAARFGGKEFAAILIDTGEKGALEVGERIRAGIMEVRFSESSDPLSVSIGVASCPADATFKEELIDKADWAMYLAKRRGRNKVLAFRSEHGSDTPEAAASVSADYVSVMSELAAARTAYTQRRRSAITHLALAVGRALDLDAAQLHAVARAAGQPTAPGPADEAHKVVALAAAYQSMVAERPYRPRVSEAEALAELVACPALLHDRAIADAFTRVLSRL